MFCLAEVDDIGLSSIRAIPTPNSAFLRLRNGNDTFNFTNSSLFLLKAGLSLLEKNLASLK